MGIERLSLEDAACVLILMFFGMAGSIPGIAPNQANEMTGAAVSGLTFVGGIGSQLLVNLAILLLTLRHAPRLILSLRRLQFAGLLAVFAVASAVWSQAPMLSVRRALPFALAGIFGLYFANRHTLQRQLALLEAALLLLAAGSVVLALGFPKLGLDASTGHLTNWQGVFTQKNACGRAMVFATAAVLAQGRITLRRGASLILFLFVLGMSGSRGAWAIEAILLTVAACHAMLARFGAPTRVRLATLVFAAAATLSVLGKVYFPLLASLMGRDPTLTGRTAIWAQVWIEILKRPWLGYGFSAFWRGTRGASFDVVVALKFVLFHAHNGFLEIWLELGAAGLLLFVLSYLRGWQQLWPLLSSERPAAEFAASRWPVFVLVLIAAYDFDENTLLSFNGFFWVLYVHALVSIEQAAAARRQGAEQPEAVAGWGGYFAGAARAGLWGAGWGRPALDLESSVTEVRPWF
jgi:O-antigen ligase